MKVLFCHHSRLLAESLAVLLDAVPGFEAEGTVFDEKGRCGEKCRLGFDVVVMGQVALRNPRVQACCDTAYDESPYKRVLMATGTSVPLLIEAMYSRFDDVLDINCSPEEMVAQLLDLHEGRRNLRDHPFWKHSVVPMEAPPRTIVYRDDVDLELAKLVSLGLSDREISDALYLASQTVRNRLSRIMARGGFKNRTQVALAYIRDQMAENTLPDRSARIDEDPTASLD